jgi:ribosomal protein S12 methylthiotransferase
MVGRTVPVLVERKLGRGSWEGRTAGDAPDIDTIITVRGAGLAEGTITKARVTGFRGYDLVGEVKS